MKFAIFFFIFTAAYGSEYVTGYTKKNGTYVDSYMRKATGSTGYTDMKGNANTSYTVKIRPERSNGWSDRKNDSKYYDTSY